MSRLARAVEILEAINAHYKEEDDLYSDDQILVSTPGVGISDAITDCLGQDADDILDT